MQSANYKTTKWPPHSNLRPPSAALHAWFYAFFMLDESFCEDKMARTVSETAQKEWKTIRKAPTCMWSASFLNYRCLRSELPSSRLFILENKTGSSSQTSSFSFPAVTEQRLSLQYKFQLNRNQGSFCSDSCSFCSLVYEDSWVASFTEKPKGQKSFKWVTQLIIIIL